jgi:hypothetical protein
MDEPMTTSSESNSVKTFSKKELATTPAMRRFLIAFAIVEAVLMGWALISSHLR